MPKAKQIPSRETLATVAKQLLQLCKGDAALAASKIAEANESGIDQFKEAIRPTPEEIFCAMTGTPPTRAEAALLKRDIPLLKKWPGTLDDFYRLVVAAKNKKQCESRFKSFLRSQLDSEEKGRKYNATTAERLLRLPEPDEKLMQQELSADKAIKNPEMLLDEKLMQLGLPVDSPAAARRYLEGFRVPRMTKRERNDEVKKRFAYYKHLQFDARTWHSLACQYLHWWNVRVTAIRRDSGLKGGRSTSTSDARRSRGERQLKRKGKGRKLTGP